MADLFAKDIVKALARRKIRAMPAMPFPGMSGIALSMSTFDLERFLDILVPLPHDRNDPTGRRN